MDNVDFKEIIKTKMISYGIAMALAGRLYGEKRQTYIIEEKESLQECEKHHCVRAEKIYSDIISLLDDISYIKLNDDKRWINNAEIISINTGSVLE